MTPSVPRFVLNAVLLLVPLIAAAGEQSLCEVAKTAAENYLIDRELIGRVSCRANERVEAGAVAQALPLQSLRAGPVVWPVRIQTETGRTTVRQIALSVATRVDGWVTSRKLTSGSILQTDDVRQESRDWPTGNLLPGSGREYSQRPQGRLLRDMRAGEWLDARSMMPGDGLQRADRVTVVVGGNALEIRFPAVLLAPAQVGQTVRVQPTGRSDVLEGRLVDKETVLVGGE